MTRFHAAVAAASIALVLALVFGALGSWKGVAFCGLVAGLSVSYVTHEISNNV